MPRKSSFLMGFESGASIYDTAKRRKMAAKQMQLQERQQKLNEDAEKLRQKLARDTLDLQRDAQTDLSAHRKEVLKRGKASDVVTAAENKRAADAREAARKLAGKLALGTQEHQANVLELRKEQGEEATEAAKIAAELAAVERGRAAAAREAARKLAGELAKGTQTHQEKILDASIRQEQREIEEVTRKKKDRVASFKVIDEIQDEIAALNPPTEKYPDGDPKWFADPDNFLAIQRIWASREDEIRDPDARKVWESSKEVRKNGAGAKMLEAIRLQERFELQYNSQMKLEERAQKSKDIKKFNGANGTNLPITRWNEIATLNRAKASVLKEASTIGTYSMDQQDWPAGMYEGVVKEAQSAVDIFKGERKIKIDDTATAAANATMLVAQRAEEKAEAERREDFKDWAKSTPGMQHMKYDTADGQKAHLTSIQWKAIFDKIDWDEVGANGLTLLAGLKEEPGGGYSRLTTAGFFSSLSGFEAGTKRMLVPKNSDQSKALLFSEVMKFNQDTMVNIEMHETPGTADFWTEFIAKGVMPDSLVGYLRRDRAQLYKNAADNFIAATLYKLSGAAITETERETGFLNYIPLPGDSNILIKQKAKQRETIMETTRTGSGLLWEDTPTRVAPLPIPFLSIQGAQDALDTGKLKAGSTYTYYDAEGNLLQGTIPGGPKKKDEGKPKPVPQPELKPQPVPPPEPEPEPEPMQPAPKVKPVPKPEESAPMEQPSGETTLSQQGTGLPQGQPRQTDVGEPETFTTPVSRWSTIPRSAPVEAQQDDEAPLETAPGELPPEETDESVPAPLRPNIPELEAKVKGPDELATEKLVKDFKRELKIAKQWFKRDDEIVELWEQGKITTEEMFKRLDKKLPPLPPGFKDK